MLQITLKKITLWTITFDVIMNPKLSKRSFLIPANWKDELSVFIRTITHEEWECQEKRSKTAKVSGKRNKELEEITYQRTYAKKRDNSYVEISTCPKHYWLFPRKLLFTSVSRVWRWDILSEFDERDKVQSAKISRNLSQEREVTKYKEYQRKSKDR